jgi:hypothetical protein
MRQGLIVHADENGVTTVLAGPERMSVMEAAYPSLRADLQPRALLRLVDLEVGTVRSNRGALGSKSDGIPTRKGGSEDPSGGSSTPESPAPFRKVRRLTGIG